jgi:hypothetical protein
MSSLDAGGRNPFDWFIYNSFSMLQVPLLRTVYRRTAFQKSSDNIVRISLDTDLHMIRELGAPSVAGDWCRWVLGDLRLSNMPVPQLFQCLVPVPKGQGLLHEKLFACLDPKN